MENDTNLDLVISLGGCCLCHSSPQTWKRGGLCDECPRFPLTDSELYLDRYFHIAHDVPRRNPHSARCYPHGAEILNSSSLIFFFPRSTLLLVVVCTKSPNYEHHYEHGSLKKFATEMLVRNFLSLRRSLTPLYSFPGALKLFL